MGSGVLALQAGSSACFLGRRLHAYQELARSRTRRPRVLLLLLVSFDKKPRLQKGHKRSLCLKL